MKTKRRILFGGFLSGALFVLLVVPVFSQGKKEAGGKKGGGDKTQYDFNVVFEGDFALLQEKSGDDPWGLTSGTGGHGNIGVSPVKQGQIPLHWDRIVYLGDASCPCEDYCEPTCASRLSNGNLKTPAEWLGFKPNDSSLGSGYDVELNFTYSVIDSADAIDIEYAYSVQAYGWADLELWDPTDPGFCARIEFGSVRMWQNSPTIKQRERKCHETFFATCEADTTDLPVLPGTFRAVIWRADTGASPPC